MPITLAPTSGAPPMERFVTRGGIAVSRAVEELPFAFAEAAIEVLVDQLDHHPGLLLSSGCDYPDRYTRWDVGFVDPPLRLTGRGRAFCVACLNERGQVLLPAIADTLKRLPDIAFLEPGDGKLDGLVREAGDPGAEEQRTRQPSLFSVIRGLLDLFASDADPHAGLYGAFGYDLALQFEPISQRMPRAAASRDLLLYLPDELFVVDRRRERA
ncbi:MAG: anthranilate synthase component I, partial [Chloroflexota bacterium]